MIVMMKMLKIKPFISYRKNIQFFTSQPSTDGFGSCLILEFEGATYFNQRGIFFRKYINILPTQGVYRVFKVLLE